MMEGNMPAQEVSFDPEMETTYQRYMRVPDDGESQAEVILGDKIYGKKVRMPRWNIPVSMLDEPKVAVKHAYSWQIPTSKEAHRQRSEYFENLHNEYDLTYGHLVGLAYDAYGKHGPLISGVVRAHFPAHVKNRLRFLVRASDLTARATRLHAQLAKSRSPLFK